MDKIRTLLLTGANNHDWARSSPFIKKLLEDSGRFTVTLTETPAEVLADARALAEYELLFSDYNGPRWGMAAEQNFAAVVHGGAGLVVLHAADNAFEGWVEYERMVGLLWREGTGHGEFHKFTVHITDPTHPITRGVQDFCIWDELYHRLVNVHGVPVHILATAYSDPERGGTGNDEPVMTATHYGRGRIFHQVLGHLWAGDPEGAYKGASMIALENPGFQTTLLRGCEWAARGEVQDGSAWV